jgi:hypothetical protein
MNDAAGDAVIVLESLRRLFAVTTAGHCRAVRALTHPGRAAMIHQGWRSIYKDKL